MSAYHDSTAHFQPLAAERKLVPFKKCAAKEECSKLCIHSVLLQECNPPKHATLCHSSANLPSLVVSIQHCGRWGGGRGIWRCIPTADHSKTLASAWTHVLRDGTLAINGHQVALANKEMCDREATPSIRLKSHFGHHGQCGGCWLNPFAGTQWGKGHSANTKHTHSLSVHWQTWLTKLTLNNPTILIKHIRWSHDALILTHLFVRIYTVRNSSPINEYYVII